MRRQRACRDITREVDISPTVGTPEYDEWKIRSDKSWEEYKKADSENAARIKAIIAADAKAEKEAIELANAKAAKAAKEEKAAKEAKEAKEEKAAKEAKEVVDTDPKK